MRTHPEIAAAIGACLLLAILMGASIIALILSHRRIEREKEKQQWPKA